MVQANAGSERDATAAGHAMQHAAAAEAAQAPAGASKAQVGATQLACVMISMIYA